MDMAPAGDAGGRETQGAPRPASPAPAVGAEAAQQPRVASAPRLAPIYELFAVIARMILLPHSRGASRS